MLSSQSLCVSLSIQEHMLVMLLSKALRSTNDLIIASSMSHLVGGKVDMASSSVPVSLNRFWLKTDRDLKVLTHPSKNVPGHPHIVSTCEEIGWPNLILPLAWHHLSVRS